MRPAAVAPVVVAGMHGSGSSLVAEFLSGLGVDMGAGFGGSVEREPLRRLQREMVAPSRDSSEDGLLDAERLRELKTDSSALAGWRGRAAGVLESQAGGTPWGWSDPVSTLLLDFWAELEPSARFVLVYRSPWEVATSLARRHRKLGLDQSTTLRLWVEYNRRILEFSDRYRERCLIFETAALSGHAGEAVELLASKLEGGLPRLGSIASCDREAFARVLAARLVRPGVIHGVREAQLPADLDPLVAGEVERALESLESRSELRASALEVAVVARGLLPPEPRSSEARVAVVIPCHDDGHYLVDALASVQLCREEPLELVIVDDGSSDPFTCDLLGHLAQKGFRILRLPHRSLAAARNSGVRATTAPCFLPLDADNLIRPEYATKALQCLEADESVGVVYSDAMRFGLRQGRWTIGPFSLDRLASENYIDACSVVRRTAWERCGGFDEQLPGPTYEDWELWLSLAEQGWKFHYLAEPLFDYRSRTGSLLASTEPEEIRSRLCAYVVNKHAGLWEPPRLGLIAARNLDQIQKAWYARNVAAEQAESWRQIAAARDEELASIKPVLAARDEELASIKPVLAARDEELASIKPVLAARDEELASIKPYLAARERELASVRSALAEREEELASLRSLLDSRGKDASPRDRNLRKGS